MQWYHEPSLSLAIILLVLGFAILVWGANLLVAGAVRLSRCWHMSPAVIGVTIVALGTSLPELVVTIAAGLKAQAVGDLGPDGPAALAIGNIVGSNIFNLGAILGLTALVAPLPVVRGVLLRDYPIMLGASLVFALLLWPWGGVIVVGRLAGGLLCLALLLFLYISLRRPEKLGELTSELTAVPPGSTVRALVGVSAGLVLLSAGGELALSGAVGLAESAGLSHRVIGLSVIAAGTSLPELATTIAAARRGHTALAVGNIIGSNIFNLLGILGIAALVQPLPVPPQVGGFDLWWMLGFTVILLPFLITGRLISRREGLVLIAGQAVYMVLILG